MKNMKNKEDLITRTVAIPAGVHVREAGEGEAPSRTITGYAILFGTESAVLWADEEEEAREIIDPSAVDRDLLDSSDIKFTMFHDRQLLLARSNRGSGTLRYNVDEKGVSFEFDAPHTVDGDKALELVRRGEISGCSFAFSTHYWDRQCVERTSRIEDGKTLITYRVKQIDAIYDMTLAADPAYPDTSVEAREFVTNLRAPQTAEEEKREDSHITEQIAEMRSAASKTLKY